tara:strand:+ start:846 stop:1016 length:171 start_codon:yes stop_codon:yes gene_type:complete
MTYELEIQIEELRAELNNACDAAERREFQNELELALAELAIIIAEQDGRLDAEPPF